jgi:tetratricopeptide (TPR) repeat protein/TolB-like protein
MKKFCGIVILLLLSGNLSGAPITRTIVVFPFVNQSPRTDLAWMSEGFAVSLSRRLAGPERYVLSRRERDAACEDQGLIEGAPLTLASEYRVAQTLGVDWAVMGTFNFESNQLTVRAQLLEVRHLKLSEPISATGELADFVDLETQLAWRLLAAHDRNFTVGSEEDFRRQFPPIRLDAFESYIRGILTTDAATRVQFLTEADRRDPADHRAAFELGRFYFDQKDYAKSVIWLRKITPADDHYVQSLFRLGVGEYFLGHDAEAARDFTLVARELPLNEAYNDLGVVNYRGGHLAEALEDFNRAHRGDPTNGEFAFNRAACLWSLKKYGEAARALEEALPSHPEDTEFHLLMADTYAKLGNSAGAEKEKQWLAAHEDPAAAPPGVPNVDYSPQPRLVKNYDGRAYRLLALALRNAFEEDLANEPPGERAQAYLARSRRMINQGNYPEAQRDLGEAISLAPGNNEAHLLMAQVYEGEGRHQAAAEELETSLKLENNAAAQVWLARIYLGLDQFSRAEEHGRAALQLKPADQDAQRLLHEIQERAAARGGKP